MTGIDRNAMFDRILPILPEFGAELQALKKDYLASLHDDPSRLDFPYYGAANALARRIVTLLENRQINTIREVFAVLDDWLFQGDDFVGEVATIGLIEDLQNGNLHPSTQPADQVGLLGPERRYWWMKVERSWLHGEIIHDDRVRQDCPPLTLDPHPPFPLYAPCPGLCRVVRACSYCRCARHFAGFGHGGRS